MVVTTSHRSNGELIVVDEAGDGIDLVREGFEVHARGGDGLAGVLLLGVGVEAVGEVAAAGKVESHDAIVRFEEGGVHGEVGGGSRVGLDVHAPLFRIQTVRLEGAFLAELLDLIDDFVSAVVTGVGKALGVFVREGGTEAFHHRLRGEVFGRDKFEAGVLAELFLFDEIVHFGIMLAQGLEPGEWKILKRRHGCTFIG